MDISHRQLTDGETKQSRDAERKRNEGRDKKRGGQREEGSDGLSAGSNREGRSRTEER